MTKDLDFEKSGIVFLEKNSQRPLQSAYTGFSSAEYRLFLDSFKELLLPALQQEDVYLQTAAYAAAVWGKILKCAFGFVVHPVADAHQVTAHRIYRRGKDPCHAAPDRSRTTVLCDVRHPGLGGHRKCAPV